MYADNNLLSLIDDSSQHSFYKHSVHNYGIYIVNEWNLNGCKPVTNSYNTVLKQNIIGCMYADFWILPETHAKVDKEIELENFEVFQHNRVATKCNRGSGGLAIAVNKSVLESHRIVSIVNGIDGQLGIKLQHIRTELIVGIVGFYLSPDSYIFGQDPENFFNEAGNIWEEFIDCDLLIGSGDLNARIKTDLDYLPDCTAPLQFGRKGVSPNRPRFHFY